MHSYGSEISKCCFSLFDWIFDSHGKATLNQDTNYKLDVQNSEIKNINLIKQIPPKESYKYVGIEIALDGNMIQQIKSLQDKCHQMATTFSQTYFNHHNAKLGFTTIYTPVMCYDLTTSSISQHTLQTIQKPMISIALSRMGFNKHMPRDVVFSSKTKGGLGIMDLYTEQGVLQIKAIITHLRSQSYLYVQMLVLLETYQVVAGIFGCPFHKNTKTHYVQSNWVQSVQGYLSHINGSIIIPHKPVIHPLRENDVPIMSAPTAQFTRSDLQEINACRLFFQVVPFFRNILSVG
jgi:hypothetical protein